MSQDDPTNRYLELVKLAMNEPTPGFPWREEEFAGLWRSQTAVRLLVCAQELGPVEAIKCDTLCAALVPAAASIQDLLAHDAPPAELLRMLAAWAERLLRDHRELLPRELALGLFNAALVVARLKCDQRLIPSLQDDDISQRAKWLATRPWIDPATRQVMQRAADSLAPANKTAGD